MVKNLAEKEQLNQKLFNKRCTKLSPTHYPFPIN